MSYDIPILEPGVVADEGSPQWWEQVPRQGGPRDYDTIEGSTPAIRASYRDPIRAFLPFNGPDVLSDAELEEREEQGLSVIGCTTDTDYIYIGVGWSDTDALVRVIDQMTQTQRPVVAYISEDSSIFRPQWRGADVEPRAFDLVSDPASVPVATK